ncbi:MAG: alanine racemase [Lachnospiraceae bacterium]|nr:alanine racemase [Lachnospiraceae bacterium]
MRKGYERVRADISLDAILANMESMKRNLKEGVQIAAVLKTNAYGHGAVEIAKVLEPLDYVWGYAVAAFEEAVELREAGLRKPILLLGYVFPYCYQELAKMNIRPAVFREDMLEQLSAAAKAAGKKIKIHIAVDTGMSRIGIFPDETGLDFVKKALETEGLQVEGMFTHFARADEADRSFTEEQLEKFVWLTEAVKERLGYEIPIRHCSNSAGIIEYPHANMTMVRAGITLYGLWPSDEVRKDIVPLEPVMSLRSHIIYIKEISAGTPVSYGGTWAPDHTVRLATVPVGYGDGWPRSLSNKGYVLIRGQKAPIRGRVCMDQFMVEVTDIPDAAEGDEVTLIGGDGDAYISMEEVGDLSGRFNYELACDINPRVPRVCSITQ